MKTSQSRSFGRLATSTWATAWLPSCNYAELPKAVDKTGEARCAEDLEARRVIELCRIRFPTADRMAPSIQRRFVEANPTEHPPHPHRLTGPLVQSAAASNQDAD